MSKTSILPEGLNEMSPDDQIKALKELAIKQDKELNEVQAARIEHNGRIEQIKQMIQDHIKDIPHDVSD